MELQSSQEDLAEAARVLEEAMIHARKEAAKYEEPPSLVASPTKEMEGLFAFA